MAASEAEEALKCKIWALKVSLHCMGCKKKVKKVLKSIDGVYDAEVDLKQQKATVRASVDPQILIHKLVKKTGKRAELWSEPDAPPKQGHGPHGAEQSRHLQTGTLLHDPKSVEHGHADPPVKTSDGDAKATGGDGAAAVRSTEQSEAAPENGGEEAKPETRPPRDVSPAADEMGGESEAVEKSARKKKTKKLQKGESAAGGPSSGDTPGGQAGVSADAQPPGNRRADPCPSTHHYTPHAYRQGGAPVVSYSTAYPGVGRYATAPQCGQAYAYSVHPGVEMEPPPAAPAWEWEAHAPQSRSPDSFELFSDENPNACSSM